MKKIEILAPAGSREQLYAAVRAGADAVYLGTKNFNARASAENFGGEDLKDAVMYCHGRDVKVYAAMNTLITDRETEKAKKEIKEIAESGADGVLIQDFGAASLWRKHCPEMPLHCSTQMTIHNVQGAKAAEDLGFKRIVLARELSLDEIRKIASSVNTEIEVFVHGAMCMSVSGTCLLSSMIGGRSGNRGRCAQPCRLNFKCRDREYALSLKDLSYTEHLRELAEAGVCSFKIEGRMKRPEYAAAAVTAVKNAFLNRPYDKESLKAVFSRSGFSDGYLTGKRTLDMFGYRTRDDVTAAAPVFKQLQLLYKDEIQKIPVSVSFSAGSENSFLEVSDGRFTASVSGEKPEKAINKPLDESYCKRMLEKTGGTPFYADKFFFDIAPGISMAASQLNAMRREALEILYEKRSRIQPKKFTEENISEKEEKTFSSHIFKNSVRLRFEKFAQSFDSEDAEKIILPLREIINHREAAEIYGKKLICELPSLVFPDTEEKTLKRLEELKALGINHVSADNIGMAKAAGNMGFTVHGGHGLNILNSPAAAEYKKLGVTDITLSPEIMMSLAENFKTDLPKGIIAYGFLPLMRFRACPAQNRNGCKDCKGLTVIKDRINTDFYILCSGKQYSSLLNSVPLYIGDKNYKNMDFSTLYFTFEPRDMCEKILKLFTEKKPLKAKKTGGLYYRELL